ncbi:MAG: glycosyltransferase family 1 protein [Candidatus Electrothrix aestuarii]|uniref:Glycosyltransferase family 1 protein n=1 Tax=Candidatus Electrothrix aestuarii TaxID=3062594 RepID=A0AAU8LY76_9BACT|nr:glycosyltransferase family 1 protein [Candidatus Electrothrix aestuarii]
MNVAYFSNQFAANQGHGIARYAHQLFDELSLLPEISITPVAAWSNHSDDKKNELTQQTGLRLLPWGRLGTSVSWTFLNWPPLEYWMPEAIDVVHAVSLGYPISTNKPYVVTIHDLGPLTHPEFFSNTNPWVMKRCLQQAIRKADAFICVSQSSADELESYVATRIAERIHVVHEGVDSLFWSKPDRDSFGTIMDLPQSDVPYILTVGKISPRKNITRVIEAFTKIIDTIPHHLVLVGGNGWDTDEVMKKISCSTSIKKRIHLAGYVSDIQLHALYSSASLYVHPSLYEGFGLPVLEAMAAGCPVVTSAMSSLPEVAGNAALFVDPIDVNAIAERIQEVCQNSITASELIEKGRQRAALFTWEQCAKRVASVYKEIV